MATFEDAYPAWPRQLAAVSPYAIVMGDPPAEKPPSFRYTMMVQSDAQRWSLFEGGPWSAPIAKLPNN
jgi:hypothetical protein